MAIDLSQFHSLFFEETVEHLSNMELLLLHADPAHPDAALLEDIGRAAHAIKGAGGSVGFPALSRLAGEISAEVAKAREDRRPADARLLASLQAGCRALRRELDRMRDAAPVAPAVRRGNVNQRAPGVTSAGHPDVDDRRPASADDAGDEAQVAARQQEAAAANDVMALLEAAGLTGLGPLISAVRELGEAIRRNAAQAAQASEDAAALRESFHELVLAIARQALTQGRMVTPLRPLPKVRRRAKPSEDDKSWPDF